MRAFLLALLAFAIPGVVCAQPLSVLHITVVLTDADGKSTPIPRHALLISDNPATITPRQIVTGPDGTVEVRLRAGNYTVESDHPVVFQGKSYQWTRTLDIAAGRDAVLELTAKNAEIESVATTAAVETDPWVVLPQWEPSVFALWTPLTRASGFVIDARGLIATSQRAVGAATAIEVQITPTVKVTANVLPQMRRAMSPFCGSIRRRLPRSARSRSRARSRRRRSRAATTSSPSARRCGS